MHRVNTVFVTQLLLQMLLFSYALAIAFLPARFLPSTLFEEPVTAVLTLAFLFFGLTIVGCIHALTRPEGVPEPSPDEDKVFFSLKLWIGQDMLGNVGLSAVFVSLALLFRLSAQGMNTDASLFAGMLLVCGIALMGVGHIQYERYVRTMREAQAQ